MTSSAVRMAILSAVLIAASSCSEERATAPESTVVQFEPAGATRVERGERLAKVLGCTGCHGKDLTGHVWGDDPKEAILYTSNLTRAVPRYSDAQLARTIRFGARPDGSPLWMMPSAIFTHLNDPDMSALIAYLRTVAPKGTDHPRIRIGPEGRRMIAAGAIKPEPQYVREERSKASAVLDRRHDWARYMIRATCSECHGIELKGDPQADGSGPPDLAVVGAYSREEFRHLLRTGEPTGGRKLKLMANVSKGRFVHLTDREVDAIYDYLKARAERPQ